MPYNSIDELPKGVKDALPEEAQNIFMGAFNGAMHSGKYEEQTCFQIAWAAVEKAGWEKDAKGNWSKPKKATLDAEDLALYMDSIDDLDVEIFSAGTWNGDEYTVDDLNDMVKNFHALGGEIKPFVKIGHDDDNPLNKDMIEAMKKDGQPAYGWIKKLRVIGDKLVASLTHVPDILKQAIKAGRYKRVSSEIYWNLKKGNDIFKRVLGAVAFLGSDAPAVTNLRDLMALLTQSTDGTGSFERKVSYSLNAENGHLKGSGSDEQGSKNFTKGDKAMTDAEKIAKLEAENLRLANALDISNGANKDIKRTAAMSGVMTYCESQVKAGAMTPSTRDAIKAGMENGKFAYTDETGFAIPFDAFRVMYEMKGSPKPGTVKFGAQFGRADFKIEKEEETDTDEEIKEFATAGDLVNAKVKKYMAETKSGDYSAALRQVMQDNPKLAKMYVEATPLVRNESVAASDAVDVESEG